MDINYRFRQSKINLKKERKKEKKVKIKIKFENIDYNKFVIFIVIMQKKIQICDYKKRK